MKPRDTAYLAHILDAIKEIQQYANSHTEQQFYKSPWDQSALVRHLEVIGEAATQISQVYKTSRPQIPWRKISDFRNVLIHEYFAIDYLLVWEIVKKDIPGLKKEIVRLLAEI